MMFALWLAVTFRRPNRVAHSNANRTIRSLPCSVIVLIEMPESSRIRRPVDPSMNRIRSVHLVGAHLELPPRVHALGVLADHDEVDLLVHARHARVQAARPDVRVQVEALAELEVRAPQAARDGRLDRPLQRHAARADRRRGSGRQRSAGPREGGAAHRLAVPLDRDAGGLDRAAGGLDHLGADPVARDQGDAVRQLVPLTCGSWAGWAVRGPRDILADTAGAARCLRAPWSRRIRPNRTCQRDREGAPRDRRRTRRRSPISTVSRASSGTSATTSSTSPSTPRSRRSCTSCITARCRPRTSSTS